MYFYVQLPLRQPQVLVWLAKEYFDFQVNLLAQLNPRK